MKNDEILRSALLRMPKVELHVHLEGAIREKTYIELATRHGGSPNPEHLLRINSLNQYSGLPSFVQTMRTICDTCLQSAEDYERITYEFLSDQADMNIIYTEFSYDPTRGMRLRIPINEIAASVDKARRRAEHDFGTRSGIIIGLGREYGVSVVTDFTRKAIAMRHYGIVGLDLHGNEELAECHEFFEAYALARKAGFGLRAHVGESTGPESIRQAVEILGVTRIAHGVSAVQDESVIALLRNQDIALDMCPISNYMLNIVNDLSRHPIRKLYDAGVKVNVSTDDPLFFYTDLIREYRVLMNTMDFTKNDLIQLNLNAIRASFASDEVKKSIEADILSFVTD